MADKYTIRDFLVYFLTGLFLLVTLLYRFDNSLLGYFRISRIDIKDNSALTVFLLVPGLYIVGHIIHGIDLLTFKSGRYVWDFKEKYEASLKRINMFWFFNTLNFIINGNRVTGILNGREQNTHDFWQKVSMLQFLGKFDRSEYWNLMNDLFKGLTLISLGWTIFFCIDHDKLNSATSLILAVLFWYRARHMATNFVSTVNNTWEAKGESQPSVPNLS